MLEVAAILQAWLDRAPSGRAELGGLAAKGAVKALVDAWSSAMVRAIAARPLALTELNRLIAALSYPSLERRLESLRSTGLVESRPGPGRSRPHAASVWLRRAVAPLLAAARWEAGQPPPAASHLTRSDAEAVFLLALPLVGISDDLSGPCRLAVEIPGGDGIEAAGVMAEVADGCIRAWLEGPGRVEAGASASGPAANWFAALLDGNWVELELAGDPDLAGALVEGLHLAVFEARQPV